ncbi:hypothetical protein ACFSQ3_11335 [Sphingobacterium corticis]|uniref:Response regulatory domain-containing protein n=1 Tax=Sphingobacterium corticis TaxID=1812823 RepID=A0ABW5NKH2_9SPHI
MKILFADESDLIRYSTLLLVEQSLIKASITETRSYAELIESLRTEFYDFIFINIDLLPPPSLASLKSIKRLSKTSRIILVVSNRTSLGIMQQLSKLAFGILDLGGDFEKQKQLVFHYLMYGDSYLGPNKTLAK